MKSFGRMEYVFSLLIRLYEDDKIDQFWQISCFQCYKKHFFPINHFDVESFNPFIFDLIRGQKIV